MPQRNRSKVHEEQLRVDEEKFIKDLADAFGLEVLKKKCRR
jgi:hypothetical protein